MGILYMIRHGQASFGSANYDLFSEKDVFQSRILKQNTCSSSALHRRKWGQIPIFPVPILRPCRDERSKY